MSAQLWKGVNVAMQSALATALTITAITKANPAVVSYTGTDPSNGDYVVLTVAGMVQLNGRVVRVANVNGAGNTFECEGVDSSAFDTFSSGTCAVITFGTTLATAVGLSASGGDFDLIDITTIHDTERKTTPGLPSALAFNFESLWDPSDTGLAALKSASDNQAERAFKFTWPSGYKYLFKGYVGASLVPTGNAQDKVTTPVQVTANGKGTAYSS